MRCLVNLTKPLRSVAVRVTAQRRLGFLTCVCTTPRMRYHRASERASERKTVQKGVCLLAVARANKERQWSYQVCTCCTELMPSARACTASIGRHYGLHLTQAGASECVLEWL